MELELGQEQGGELPHAGVPVIQERQRVKVLWLRELMRLGHCRFEALPGQHRLDGGKRIAAAGARFDQGVSDRGIESYLFVDGLAAFVEFVGVRTFGLLEHAADQLLEHVERFVGQGGGQFEHHGREGRVPAQRLEVSQVLHGCLPTLAGELQPVILVNSVGALRFNPDRANLVQPFDQLGEIACRGGKCRLAEPRQSALIATRPHHEELIEGRPLDIGQPISELTPQLPMGATPDLPAESFDDRNRRHHHPSMSQLLERNRRQRASLLGGQRRGQEPRGQVAVNRPIENAVAHEGLDFSKMLATSLVTLGVVAEVCRLEAQLLGDEGEHGRRRLLVLA